MEKPLIEKDEDAISERVIYPKTKRVSSFKEELEDINRGIINKLMKVSIFCACFMTIEFFGGYIAGSLAIMTDAAHLLSDLSGFVISMLSLYIALRPANQTLTYGYHRAEIIGAMTSILIIWILTVYLIIEAIHRLYNPQPIRGFIMMGIAFIGLLFNLIMGKILTENNLPNAFESAGDDEALRQEEYRALEDMQDQNNYNVSDMKEETKYISFDDKTNGEKKDLTATKENKDKSDDNPVLRAAVIHIIGDMIQSAGVLVAAITVYIFEDTHPGVIIVDPICTFIFAIIVLSTSIPVTRDCISVLMESAPASIQCDKLIDELMNIDDIVDIHDVHVWSLSLGKPALSAHYLSNAPQRTLEAATKICKKYGIYHTTIQVEDNRQRRRSSFQMCTHAFDNYIH